ncbi:MAG: 6-carboxytetrahydropterin synthase QueD [Candidatus Zixiibacteriota bacterium]
MRVSLIKEFRFEASHRLNHLGPDHPCHNLHGHSYRVEVEVSGVVDTATGFLIDYGELKKLIGPIIDRLDHKHLNDIEDLQITTTEHLAKWLWDRIQPLLPILSRITVFETASSRCEYRGE